MIINLFSAGLFGAVIPLVLEKFKIDPAIGSTVILTTVTDIVGFFSFLGLATLILVWFIEQGINPYSIISSSLSSLNSLISIAPSLKYSILSSATCKSFNLAIWKTASPSWIKGISDFPIITPSKVALISKLSSPKGSST